MTTDVAAVLCGARSWTWSVYIFWVRCPNPETCCPVGCRYSSFGVHLGPDVWVEDKCFPLPTGVMGVTQAVWQNEITLS